MNKEWIGVGYLPKKRVTYYAADGRVGGQLGSVSWTISDVRDDYYMLRLNSFTSLGSIQEATSIAAPDEWVSFVSILRSYWEAEDAKNWHAGFSSRDGKVLLREFPDPSMPVQQPDAGFKFLGYDIVEFLDPYDQGHFQFAMGCVESPLVDNYLDEEIPLNPHALIDSEEEAFERLKSWKPIELPYWTVAKSYAYLPSLARPILNEECAWPERAPKKR